MYVVQIYLLRIGANYRITIIHSGNSISPLLFQYFLGDLHILRRHIFRLYVAPIPAYISIFSALKEITWKKCKLPFSKHKHTHTSLPTSAYLRNKWMVPKGQLISKCLFGVFNFSQKTNENKSTWGIIVFSKVEFFRSFFGRIEDTKKSFWN